MRKLLFSLLVVTFAFGVAGVTPRIHAQDDALALVCSAPADGATVGVVPNALTLWFNQDASDVTVAVNDADGASVAAGDAEIDGAVVTVALDGESLAAEATYTIDVTVGEDTITRTFTIGANALAQGDAELVNDCPEDMDMGEGDEAADEGDEAAADEGDEAAADEGDEAAADEGDEAAADEGDEAAADEGDEGGDEAGQEGPALGEAIDGSAGSVNFTVQPPAEYADDTIEGYFLFPVTVMAADDDAIASYVDDPDDVEEYVIIFTSFTAEDLGAFNLEGDVDGQAIIDVLIREDSSPEGAAEATVAGAPALRVNFANEVSGKSGAFYLVTFEDEDGAVNYLLIQGSAPTDEWEANADNFQAVVDSIALVEE